MAARTLPISSTANRRSRLLAGCALAAASLALLQAWTGEARGQVVSVSVPRISVQVPHVTVQVPNITAQVQQTTASIGQTVSQVASSVGASVPNVRAQVASIVASVGATTVDLPDVASDVASQIAANTAAAVTAGLGNVQGAVHGNHGLAALVGPGSRTAEILAHTGAITVASGTVHTVDFYGDGLINFAVDGLVAPMAGSGSAVTNGGAITISAAAATSIVDRAINMQGVAQIQAITVHDGAVALVVDADPVRAHGPVVEVRADPLAAVLAQADFHPGGATARLAIRYGEREPVAERGGAGWSGDGSKFFGTVETSGAASSTSGSSVRPEPDARATPLTAAGNPEQEEELAEALTVLAQIDILVGHEQLAPADVCQSAGGGGVGLPGCGASESFGAAVSLAPDATGEGCALLAGGGGIQLQCGGEALPAVSAPALDPSVTLQDLMDQWLVPAGPATVHPSGGLLASTASASLSLN